MIVSTASIWQKKGRGPTKLVMAPMLQEPLGDRGHAPVGGIAQAPPPLDVAADLVDQRVLGVGLQIEGRLRGRRLLPRGRNRHDEARRAATLPRLSLERLTVLVERVVQFRRPIGRVQNRPIVETVQILRPPRNSLGPKLLRCIQRSRHGSRSKLGAIGEWVRLLVPPTPPWIFIGKVEKGRQIGQPQSSLFDFMRLPTTIHCANRFKRSIWRMG